MANLTPPNLTVAITIGNNDLLVVWPTGAGGPLAAIQWSAVLGLVTTAMGSTFLKVANNFSDVGSASLARTNLGVPGLTTPNAFTGLQTFSGGVAAMVVMPQGRLTLQTGVPVPVTDQTSATTVYYAPYLGQAVPVWNGSAFVMTDTAGQLSQTTTDTTKSPAAVTTNSNYDLFVWIDAGTVRCTRGPAWTSATARGAGAGTTQLTQLGGVYVNTVSITNGPGANLGTYVGTVRSDGSSQLNDSVLKRNVWNMYNRRPRAMAVLDPAASWTYTTNVYRQANGNAANAFQVVRGFDEDSVQVDVRGGASNASGAAVTTGVGVDSTTVTSSTLMSILVAGSVRMDVPSTYIGYPGLGFHSLNWLEFSAASGTTTWYGTFSVGAEQCGMVATVQA